MRWLIILLVTEDAAFAAILNLAVAWFILWSALFRRQLWLSLRPQGQPRPNRQDILSIRPPRDQEGWG